MCPSVEGSLRDLVHQVAHEENLNLNSFSNNGADAETKSAGGGTNNAFNVSTQLKLGSRLSDIQDSIKHIFEG